MQDYTDADLMAIIKQCQRSATTKQSFYDVWQEAAAELTERGIEAPTPTADELMWHITGAPAGSSVLYCAGWVMRLAESGYFAIRHKVAARIQGEVEAAENTDAPWTAGQLIAMIDAGRRELCASPTVVTYGAKND